MKSASKNRKVPETGKRRNALTSSRFHVVATECCGETNTAIDADRKELGLECRKVSREEGPGVMRSEEWSKPLPLVLRLLFNTWSTRGEKSEEWMTAHSHKTTTGESCSRSEHT